MIVNTNYITIANGKIWRGELRNKAKDGTIYWVDITERKKAEEQLLTVKINLLIELLYMKNISVFIGVAIFSF